MQNDWQKAENVLKQGGIAIVPTDTLYGIVGSAFDKKAVERIYKVRGRNKNKPCVVLISSIKDLDKFGIKHSNILQNVRMFLNKKVSVILQVLSDKFKYLHRGKKSLAFRLITPRNKNLFNILQTVGPLIAASANPEGLEPAKNRKQARVYFGKTVDSYVCSGTKIGKASTIVDYTKTKPKVVRQGSVMIIF